MQKYPHIYNNMWEDTGKRPRLLPLDKFSPGRYLKASSVEVTRDLRNCQTLCMTSLEPPKRKRNRSELEAAHDLALFLVATEHEVHYRRQVFHPVCARDELWKRRRLSLIGSERSLEPARKRARAVRVW